MTTNKELTNHELSENKINDNERSLKISKLKIIYLWFPIWRMMTKAKKISKKNYKTPGFYSEEYAYNFAKKSANRILKASNINITVEGYENWLDRGVILAANHQSNFDPTILFALNNFYLNQPMAFIAKKELWNDKKLGRFVRIIDCIPLDRESPRNALEAFKEAKELVVDYKRSLVIFPEGTRSKSQEIKDFHPAALKIAQMANAPVIPVTIINAYQIFKKDRPKKVEVKVIFGKPIMPSKHISLKTEDLSNNVRKVISENMEKYKDKDLIWDYKTINKINPKNEEEIRESIKKKTNPSPKKQKKKLKDIFNVVD
ncbi:lysophospholipid acyltransferase family protein [Mesoplasma corruscae]|uniref:1-acyl-sn-glycerol-3-phosphate acyltransferase n=1 Tax=Mesoplasma corruscae TaxID=216874 RepID=A0A2S5RG57_9MOLU|nr:lysophospholipid acyltransferase family protein [Mesoplasma corruscae]PPE06277.1 1-acyl-sn-glycerol-3-phosphate acyltransferase [Mesoplasma corruscae]